MTSSHPIIAAIDPSRYDVAPAALGVLLAQAMGAPLVLASAVAVSPQSDVLFPEYEDALRAAAGQALEPARDWAAAHGGPALDVSTACVPAFDSPAAAIHTLAERRGAATIVVGSSRRGRVGRLLPGAVTDRLLHGAPCPVAVATPGFAPAELRRIGVAFVDRADGWAAVRQACALAESTGALVRVLTVREPLDPRFIAPLAADQLGELERAGSDAVERVLRAGVAAVPPSRSDGGEVLVGDAPDELATASDGLDLLVCGSRGYGPVRTLVLGGVAHTLVRRAHCPVLVVPLPDPAPPLREEIKELAA